ncbi:MAG: SCO family protein [Chitinophagaceae bacterium]|nr:SCO family protein [Chitinophagaceae bacterium]
MNKYLSRLMALVILIGFPLGFFFYYKQKVDALGEQQKEVPVFWDAPAFSFQTQNGDTLSASDLKGHAYVADFIFTNCEGVCPKLSQTLSLVQLNFKNDKRLKLVSFTVDPDRDSIPVLKEYAKRYDAIDGKWYFLRGEKETVWKMAQEGFKVPVVYTPEGGKGNEFTHTERIVLVDQDGKIRGFYNGLDKQMMDTFYNNLASILVGIPQQ